jgi:hypothetical protein
MAAITAIFLALAVLTSFGGNQLVVAAAEAPRGRGTRNNQDPFTSRDRTKDDDIKASIKKGLLCDACQYIVAEFDEALQSNGILYGRRSSSLQI